MDAMPKRRPWVLTIDAGWVWVVLALLLFWAAVGLGLVLIYA